MEFLERAIDLLRKICILLSSIALVVMTVIFGWLVFGRYVLNATPTWVEQAALLLVMVITFLGAAAGIREKSHLSVRMFVDALPERLAGIANLIVHLVVAGFGAVMAWYSYQLVLFKWTTAIPLIGLPEGLRALPIAIAGLLISLFSAWHFIAQITGRTDDASQSDPNSSQPPSNQAG